MLALSFHLIGMVKLGLTVRDVQPHFGLGAKATTDMLHALGRVEDREAQRHVGQVPAGMIGSLITADAAISAAVRDFGRLPKMQSGDGPARSANSALHLGG